MQSPDRRSFAFAGTVALLLIEVRLGKDGKGQGKLAGAAKITYDKETNTIEIENYGIEPVRLTQVEVLEPKPKK